MEGVDKITKSHGRRPSCRTKNDGSIAWNSIPRVFIYRKWIMRKLIFFVLLTLAFSGCDTKNNSVNPYSSLHAAVLSNDLNIIKKVIQNGVNINEQNQDGITALLEAIRCVGIDPAIVEYLLNEGADPDICNYKGMSPLDTSIMMDKNKEAVSLIKHGAALPEPHSKELTILHNAIIHCNTDVIQAILDNGGESYLFSKDNFLACYPVELAINMQNETTADVILDRMDLNHQNNYGNTLFHEACMKANTNLIKLLLKRNIDINKKNNQGLTAYDLAKNHNPGSKEILDLLVENGAKEGKDVSLVEKESVE